MVPRTLEPSLAALDTDTSEGAAEGPRAPAAPMRSEALSLLGYGAVVVVSSGTTRDVCGVDTSAEG